MSSETTGHAEPGSPGRGHRGRRVARLVLVVAALLALGCWGWRVHDETSLRRQASIAAGSGDWAAVERALDRLAGYRRLDAESLRLRIVAARRRDDPATAAALLGQLEGSDAEVASARLEQGRLLLELGQLRGAENAFQRVSDLSPASYAPRKARIGILGLERRGDDQERALWDLVDHGRSRPEACVEALCLLARGGPVIPGDTLRPGEDEGTALDRALRADPDNPHVRAARAYFLRNRGLLDQARQIVEPWFREHGDEPPVGDEYVELLLDEGRLDEAEPLLKASAAAGSSRPTARRFRLLGMWNAMRGRPAEAVAAFRESIRLDPRDPELRHRLAQALRAGGQEAEAKSAQAWVESARTLRRLVEGIDFNAPEPAAIARAAALCREMGRDREAEAWQGLAR